VFTALTVLTAMCGGGGPGEGDLKIFHVTCTVFSSLIFACAVVILTFSQSILIESQLEKVCACCVVLFETFQFTLYFCVRARVCVCACVACGSVSVCMFCVCVCVCTVYMCLCCVRVCCICTCSSNPFTFTL
jgi:hypothetical protein